MNVGYWSKSISWNDPETVFHEMPWKKNFTVYPSLYSKSVKLKVGHVYGALETCAWLGIHINSELISLLWVFCGKKIAWRKCGGGAKAPSARPAGVVGPEKTIETVIK